MPAHNYIDGITLPGGTTEFGPITAPFSILEPSKITVLCPIKTSSSIVHEYKVQFG